MPTDGKCSLVPMKESFSKHPCAVFHSVFTGFNANSLQRYIDCLTL